MTISRRKFIKGMGACALTTGLFNSVISRPTIAATASGDYRALVCLFFLGGLDNNDTIIHRDEASYNRLANARKGIFRAYGVGDSSSNSSRERRNLLPIEPINTGALAGRQYGLPRELAPLHEMFNNEELAIVGSVGPLMSSNTNRTTFANGSVAIPPRLFSHNDQQNYWQGLAVEGATMGWGGRFIDELLASPTTIDPLYAAIITSSTSLFLNGSRVNPFRVTPNGPLPLDIVNSGVIRGGSETRDTRELVRRFLERRDFGANNLYQQDLTGFRAQAIENANIASAAYAAAPDIRTQFPRTGIGQQLRGVANAIQARGGLGVERQMFFSARGGFDTHASQADQVPNLQSEIAEAIKAFRDAMVEIGMWDKVTLFTASDFGRSMVENGDGTDHGWGSHHFVAGGSVRGKRIFGSLPSADISSQEYTESRGRLIPKVSIEEYGATFGRWLGLNDTQVNGVLPNLQSLSGGRNLDMLRS